jgi:hypothetical protein
MRGRGEARSQDLAPAAGSREIEGKVRNDGAPEKWLRLGIEPGTDPTAFERKEKRVGWLRNYNDLFDAAGHNADKLLEKATTPA